MTSENFYSVDRLVEFGLGMAMAQQMVQVMNQSMKQMYVPGSIQSMPMPSSLSFHLALDGKPVGPFSESELARLIGEGKVTKDTLVWAPCMLGWKPAEQTSEFLRIVASVPPPLP